MLSGAFGYLTDYLLWLAIYVSLLVHTWCFFRFFPRDKHRKSGLLIGNGLDYTLPLLLAVLNSRIVALWLSETGIPLRGNYMRMKTAYLRSLPLPP